MSAYKDRFEGRPAAVLGGGPSLPGDMRRLPKGCLLIAVNYHALYLSNTDFLVYNDDPGSDLLLAATVYKATATRISPWPSSEVEFDVPVWTGNSSSHTAAWFGLWCGCDPVILCGMDCYQGEQVYCHPTDREGAHFHQPLENYLRPWKEDGRNLLPHVERLRVMSGPMIGLFPAYEPDGREATLTPDPSPFKGEGSGREAR